MKKNKIIELIALIKENEIIKFNSTTQFVVKDIWEKDIVKNNLIIDHGYNILIIWESDYINFKDNIIKLILDKIVTSSKGVLIIGRTNNWAILSSFFISKGTSEKL